VVAEVSAYDLPNDYVRCPFCLGVVSTVRGGVMRHHYPAGTYSKPDRKPCPGTGKRPDR
jgi:hypothetical protein